MLDSNTTPVTLQQDGSETLQLGMVIQIQHLLLFNNHKDQDKFNSHYSNTTLVNVQHVVGFVRPPDRDSNTTLVNVQHKYWSTNAPSNGFKYNTCYCSTEQAIIELIIYSIQIQHLLLFNMDVITSLNDVCDA